MYENSRRVALYERKPLHQLLISLLIIAGTGIVLFLFFIAVGVLTFKADPGALQVIASDLTSSQVAFLRYFIICQHISFFIVPAIIIMIKMNPEQKLSLSGIGSPELKEAVLVILLAFCLFPITSFTGQLNSEMSLPQWLSGMEHWMSEKEDKADTLIDLVMVTDTFRGMMINLIMIAILPAIGEELIFRGIFQRIMTSLFKSGHIAIWITAFLFSAVHLQFYGFIPRFILGLVFGYLFFWSGTLWLPVISHFVNNAVAVVVSYIRGPESMDAAQGLSSVAFTILPFSIVISIIILQYFRNKNSVKPAVQGHIL